MTQRELNLQQMLRASHVDRWQIVNVAVRQSVAEHMYRVWTITNVIVGQLEAAGWEDLYARMTAGAWALVHDLPEVIVGDIPTPTKELMVSRGNENNIDSGISQSVDQLKFAAESDFPIVADIVKIADLAESIDFLSMNGLGENSRKICDSIRLKLRQKLEHCRHRYAGNDWDGVQNVLHHNIEGGI